MNMITTQNVKSFSKKRVASNISDSMYTLFFLHLMINFLIALFKYKYEFDFLQLLCFLCTTKIISMIIKLYAVIVYREYIPCDEYKIINDLEIRSERIFFVLKNSVMFNIACIICALMFYIFITYILLIYDVKCIFVDKTKAYNNDKCNDFFWNSKLIYIYYCLLLLLLFDMVLLIILYRFIHIKIIFYILCVIYMELFIDICNIIMLNIVLSSNSKFNLINFVFEICLSCNCCCEFSDTCYKCRHTFDTCRSNKEDPEWKNVGFFDIMLLILNLIILVYAFLIVNNGMDWLTYIYIKKHTVTHEEVTNVEIDNHNSDNGVDVIDNVQKTNVE